MSIDNAALNLDLIDVPASNGVIHVIDRVLIPNSVYKLVLKDLREQLREIRSTFREVARDRVLSNRPL